MEQNNLTDKAVNAELRAVLKAYYPSEFLSRKKAIQRQADIDDLFEQDIAAGKVNEDDKNSYRAMKRRELETRMNRVRAWNVDRISGILSGQKAEDKEGKD